MAPSFITQANLAVIVDHRLVVTGFINGDLNGLTIIDLRVGKTMEDIWCYSPILSPDHRFIAYVRFYPTHPGEPSWTSDVYLIYDLHHSPQANRLPAPGYYSNHMFVGIPVYPIENARAYSYFLVAARSWEDRHSLASRFVWKSATLLTFTDDYRGIRSAVTIDLQNGLYRPSIFVSTIGTARY